MSTRTTPALASALRVSVVRLARRLRQEGQPDDATPSQLSALATLYHSGPMTLGELAHAEHIKPPSMTRVVAGLEERGLVRRDSSTDDGRVVRVTTTRKGTAAYEDYRERREAWLCLQLAQLDPAERALLATAADLLDRMREAP